MVLFNSCRRCSCPVNELQIGFVGFDSLELNTVVLKQYVSGNGFQDLVATKILDSFYTTEFKTDTAYKPYCRIAYGNDWKIELPEISATYYLTDVQKENVKEPYCNGLMVGERFCNHNIASAQLNQQVVYSVQVFPPDVILYIHK